jgi:O-antigen ligase
MNNFSFTLPIDLQLKKRLMKIRSRFLEVWFSVQHEVAFLLCLGMMAGFFWSRALLSLSVVALFVNALHPQRFSGFLLRWKKDRFALCCFLFFATYLIGGLWSENKEQWWDSVTNKLPFAVLPFAFYAVPLHKLRFQKLLIASILIMQLLVIAYSLFMLFSNSASYIEGYKHSHALPTTKYDDHIRFSLSLVLSLIMIAYLLFERGRTRLTKRGSAALLVCSIIFIVYLHVLAAKTGLLCLYVAAFVYLFWKVYQKKGLLFGIPAGMMILLLPLMAYFTVPTFRLKVDYVGFELRHLSQQQKYNYNLSDQGRILSYKMGWHIIQDHPMVGVGVGDVLGEMALEYQKFYPEVPEENVLIPHNQYIFTLVALGFPLCLALVLLSLTLFRNIPGRGVYVFTTSIVMIIAMMVEAMLEVQFGIFVFLFYSLFWLSPRLDDANDKGYLNETELLPMR